MAAFGDADFKIGQGRQGVVIVVEYLADGVDKRIETTAAGTGGLVLVAFDIDAQADRGGQIQAAIDEKPPAI